jgi:hypothetical protein
MAPQFVRFGQYPTGAINVYHEQSLGHVLHEDLNEVFELKLPILSSNPVYTEDKLTHSVGNSWGKPAVVKSTLPSDIAFNSVVSTLHISLLGRNMIVLQMCSLMIFHSKLVELLRDTVLRLCSTRAQGKGD